MIVAITSQIRPPRIGHLVGRAHSRQVSRPLPVIPCLYLYHAILEVSIGTHLTGATARLIGTATNWAAYVTPRGNQELPHLPRSDVNAVTSEETEMRRNTLLEIQCCCIQLLEYIWLVHGISSIPIRAKLRAIPAPRSIGRNGCCCVNRPGEMPAPFGSAGGLSGSTQYGRAPTPARPGTNRPPQTPPRQRARRRRYRARSGYRSPLR